jgi:hypothetical protein
MGKQTMISSFLAALLILVGALPVQADVVNFDSIQNTESVYNSIDPNSGFGPQLVFTGVTFNGGVVMNDLNWYGSAPYQNILATSDLNLLADDSHLPGNITGTFDTLVSSVSLYIMNGYVSSSANFTLSAYDQSGNLLGSDTVNLSGGEWVNSNGNWVLIVPSWGQLALTHDGIKSIVISSEQTPFKNFAIDNVNFTSTAVPLPGAVWLLGSGLLSMGGWRRFRKS